jgi:hypothetical protein
MHIFSPSQHFFHRYLDNVEAIGFFFKLGSWCGENLFVLNSFLQQELHWKALL